MLGIDDYKLANRSLNMLCADRVLRLIERGGPHNKSSRYRYFPNNSEPKRTWFHFRGIIMANGTRPRINSAQQRLADIGFELELSEQSQQNIAETGMRGTTLPIAMAAAQIALEENPLTLRGLFYRVVSAGLLPSTDRKHYAALGRILTTLREAGIVPFHWLVDSVRSTLKPSSWSGLQDFAETVRRAYRKDFWSELPDYVHVFCEKDAIAGVLQPVTSEFDVALSPIRGYASVSFAHEIAATWSDIEKPIHAFYLGDFDPSGFDLERDWIAKLTRYCHRPFTWERLGVNAADFNEFDLLPLKPKETDRRYRKFVATHGRDCAEVDAIPSTELR